MTRIVGIHQQYQGDRATTPEATLREYPLTMATREFTSKPIDPQNLIPRVEKLCRKVWDQDLIAVWSVKPKPYAVANGDWMPHFQQLAAHIRDEGLWDKFVLCIWHEPENDVPTWFPNGPAFVRMFNQVHHWVKAVSPNITTMHAALGYRYGDKRVGRETVPIDITDEQAKYWRTKADIQALDLYQGRSWPLDQIAPENSAFKRWHTHVVGGPGNPFAFSERGFLASPGNTVEQALRAATLKREADWLVEDQVGRDCQMVLLWDTEGSERDPKLPISDQGGKDAVQYYMERMVEAEQEPTPEQPTGVQCPVCQGTGTVPADQTVVVVQNRTANG